MSPENVEIVRAALQASFERDTASFMAALDPAIEWTPVNDDPDYRVHRGLDDVAAWLAEWSAVFPDMRWKAETIVDAGGDRVVALVRALGRGDTTCGHPPLPAARLATLLDVSDAASAVELPAPELPAAELPAPPSERHAWLLALGLLALGAAVLVAVLSGAIGSGSNTVLPPPVPAAAVAPLAPGAGAPGVRASQSGGAIVTRPSAAQQRADARRFTGATRVHIAKRWMEGFYPIYSAAQSTFGVNWLLVASIHMQESAFSTAPGIYAGLNFAHCCGGPMQFNVTNGPVTTWDLVSNSYAYGTRPRAYDHMTRRHPSIYDDFDAIMAAAHLLSADGAGYALDISAWDAAYDYYGHDATGVVYADQVLARAIGWSQHGFCINCGVDPGLVAAVHAAYGAPVAAAIAPAPRHAAPARRRAATRTPRAGRTRHVAAKR